jgi:hypothetical protein
MIMPSVSPPVGPTRQFDPETRRFADEVAGVLHRRLLVGNAIAAVAFAMMILVALASPDGQSGYPIRTVYTRSLILYTGMAVWYAALVLQLLRHRDMPLFQLRVIEVLGLTAYAAHSAWKDFEHYSRYWQTLRAGEQWFLVSHSCLNWVFLILIYGVLIPNDWRRSLRILTAIAVIPLAVYAATWWSFEESHRSAL